MAADTDRGTLETPVASAPPIGRQAIVVVHGQGEQRPMGTIRDFVKVLWEFNPELGPLEEIDGDGRDVWIVPDDKSGLFELQRVTTPEHQGRRTDFFELYYADLLNDTPLRNLWRWGQRLLWIDPADVPDRMRWPWTTFWLLSLLAIVLAGAVALSIPHLLHADWFAPLTAPRAWPALGIGGVALLVLLAPKFFRSLAVLEAVPSLLLFLVIAAAVISVYSGNPIAWATIVLIFLLYLAVNFLLPFFGDAASYLSAQTETVQSRQVVRNRGLALLRALHDDPKYDRVVLIGHSLGSVLAYDLLHILWRGVGPTKDNPPTADAVAALEALDHFTAAMPPGAWTAENIAVYQALQWQAFNELRQQRSQPEAGSRPAMPGGWKISDFVALGSPLSSAQFLVTESKSDFIRMKKERVLPTAPPQPYDAKQFAVYIDEQGRKVAHHGAVFSTVRWTNIYDAFNPVLFLIGDPIAGPASGIDRFGDAVQDRQVEIRRGTLNRFFTHSHYWIETSGDWSRPSNHISTLRAAVGIDRPPPQ